MTLVALLVGSGGCGKTDSAVTIAVGGERGADAASAGAPSETAGVAPAGELAGGSSAESSVPADSVALTPEDGWLDADSNPLMLHGDLYVDGDATSVAQSTPDLTGSHACLSGLAARVELSCEIVPPARDCFEMFGGPELRLNLNQDPGAEPQPFDATGLKGFSFDFEGGPVTSIRLFATASDGTRYCSVPSRPVTLGHNEVLFSEMREQCFKSEPGHPTAVEGQAELVSFAWHVVTKTSSTTAFDFCVSNLRALLQSSRGAGPPD